MHHLSSLYCFNKIALQKPIISNVDNLNKSIEYSLRKILKPIVPLGRPVVQTVVDQFLAVDVELCVIDHVWRVEPELDLADGLLALLKAGHGHPT